MGFGVFEGDVVSAEAGSERRGPNLNIEEGKEERNVLTVP